MVDGFCGWPRASSDVSWVKCFLEKYQSDGRGPGVSDDDDLVDT